MAKRKRSDEEAKPAPKRPRLRLNQFDFSLLSDELILKVLSYLPIPDLAHCQRVSRQLGRLASDPELWKERYYSRWVRPRILWTPRSKRAVASSQTYRYSSKLAKWLDDGHLVQQGHRTDWKRQYRLRDNWWRGCCRVQEVEIAPPASPVLVKISQGITFTADAKAGLRAWTTKTKPSLIASSAFALAHETTVSTLEPSTINVDNQTSDGIQICIGFHDGAFQVHLLRNDKLSLRHHRPPIDANSISAIAMHSPYIATISQQMTLSIYHFYPGGEGSESPASSRLIASLKSNRVSTPLFLSMRSSSRGLLVSIAYGFPSWNLNWAVGLQELRMIVDEDVSGQTASPNNIDGPAFSYIKESRSAHSQQFVLHPEMRACPTALSYSHPYLLAALPDNTLMIYLVTSTATNLEISSGRRLWGHTSHVSGLQVSERGKAVSVSLQGNDIRVWELEDVKSPSFGRRGSVRVQPKADRDGDIVPEVDHSGEVFDFGPYGLHLQGATVRSWVGFDEDHVVVLGEQSHRQILACYDFT